MVVTSSDETAPASSFKAEYDIETKLNAKAGVKGLVDTGTTKIPRIFHHPISDNYIKNILVSGEPQLSIPVIDLKRLNKEPDQRKEIVERVREALETWGFFQIVNHGIVESFLEEMKMVFIVFTSGKLG
ncbi:Non-heme dioxygenase N-terminal domain containing protein [Parasponia andersonii]|uniref:Non-heme dioxygenase N-terminal domain containing protein n=1 Tax=Parasponia andersonii TaxID=3476 RepID=A0A2P5A9W9_PARAD|nr:Non-heme dioxygenase N-terminal domain containing protein [Parasponia andersonii]